MTNSRTHLTLGNLGRIVTGKTPPTKRPEYYGGNIPFITPCDMDGKKVIRKTERTLTESGAAVVRNAILPANSVMVSCIGSDMGKVAIAGTECVTNQQINSIIVSEAYCPDYIYYDLSTRKDELQSLASGSAQPILNKGHFSEVPLELPSIEKQQRIADVLGKLDDKIELNRRMNRTLEKMAAAIFKSWFIDFLPVRAKMAAKQQDQSLLLPQAEPNTWFVYALECDDGSLYIGQTEDLRERWMQHTAGKGGRWTKAHPPQRVAYWERQPSREAAVEREKWLKTGFGRKWLKKEIAAIARTQTGDPVYAKAEGRAPNLPAEIANLFPDTFEDSDLGSIPKGWKVAPMKDLADVNARSIKKDYPHARIRYVDISSVNHGSLEQTTTYDLADAPSRAKRLVKTGDTIWSCVRPNRKAYHYIDRPADNLVVSTGFAVLSPRTVPASYLHQWVTTQAFVDNLTAYATGAAYPAVKADTFETAKMLLPGKDILNAFHNLVDPLRARIAHNQRQNRRLAGLRDTLLPKLLSGEIELPEAEAIAEEVT